MKVRPPFPYTIIGSVLFAVSAVLALLVAIFLCTRDLNWLLFIISFPFWSAAILLFLAATGFRRAARSGLIGGLLVGGIAFIVGFFGPIFFASNANFQGPLLGVLFTGPIGTLVGTITGLLTAIIMKGIRQPKDGEVFLESAPNASSKKNVILNLVIIALLVFFVATAAMLSKGPPVTLTVVGKTGRKYTTEVALAVRVQNHRLWSIYYHGLGGPMSATYRISRRTDSGWQELRQEQYTYVSPVVRETIPPWGSTTIRVYATETDSSKESRIGLDCYTIWDCEMLSARCPSFSFPATVWSMPQPINFANNSLLDIRIMVEEDGTFGIAGHPFNKHFLASILNKAFAEYGSDIPIVITRRKGADHQNVSPVVDLCASIGITNIILKTIDAPIGM